ncbi:MAG: AMP-binding protein [bacterium]|nr:AMP-binding protein [bacterium]
MTGAEEGVLANALRDHGSAEAIRMGATSLTWSALAHASRRMQAALEDAGVAKGDLVAVLAPPSVEGAALLFALLELGAPMLPLNARLSEIEQAQAIEETHARFLVVAPSDALGSRLARETGCGLLALAPRDGASPLARLESPDGASPLVRLESPDGASPLVFLASPAPGRADELAGAAERRRDEGAALVLRTSGTSGRPKGAVLGLDNLIASADGAASLLGSSPSDRWLLCMPLFHIGGLAILIRASRVGASVVLHARFDEVEVARALDEDGITRVSFVATMLERVLATRGDRPAPATLELVLLGGGPASDDLIRRAEALGYPLAPTYGLTEAASQVATRPPRAAVDEPAGGLVPLGGVSLRIVDENGTACAPGVEGEIRVRGPIVMRGYLDDPEASRAALLDGWLATGDIGRLDEAGRLRVLDRRTDLILSGGENVYPAQIESVLEAHPDVVEAGVRGIEDETYGARPAAWVVLREEARLAPSALLAYCRARLAGYAVPARIETVDVLPRNATGKLLRRRLGGDD